MTEIKKNVSRKTFFSYHELFVLVSLYQSKCYHTLMVIVDTDYNVPKIINEKELWQIPLSDVISTKGMRTGICISECSISNV